jgi:hypothetical protein
MEKASTPSRDSCNRHSPRRPRFSLNPRERKKERKKKEEEEIDLGPITRGDKEEGGGAVLLFFFTPGRISSYYYYLDIAPSPPSSLALSACDHLLGPLAVMTLDRSKDVCVCVVHRVRLLMITFV